MTDTKKTREAHEAYVANRREAGRVIDIETCNYGIFYTELFDPYLTYPWDDDPPDRIKKYSGSVQKCLFVCSEASGGWIELQDLPKEKQEAFLRRVERERANAPPPNPDMDEEIPF
jgi:hypothetical protein